MFCDLSLAPLLKLLSGSAYFLVAATVLFKPVPLVEDSRPYLDEALELLFSLNPNEGLPDWFLTVLGCILLLLSSILEPLVEEVSFFKVEDWSSLPLVLDSTLVLLVAF